MQSRRPTLARTLSLAAALILVPALPGCRSATPDAQAPPTAANAKRYPVQGKVMAVNAASGEVELDGAAIPGFMDAMVMPYKLKDPAILSELHPGDMIRATLLASDAGDLLDEIVITGQTKPVAAPTGALQPLTPGEPVPDFALVNQNGKTIHLAQYHGKVLLVTFVYTRCPLADYCPRMSRNFAAVDKALAQDPKAYAGTHLLTVSFDPKYDTPAVLKSYGGAYTGNYTRETFAHWEFVVPREQELSKLLNFFDVAATPERDKTVTHSLSTVAIAPDGKIYKWYPDNEWTPAELVADAKKALGQSA